MIRIRCSGTDTDVINECEALVILPCGLDESGAEEMLVWRKEGVSLSFLMDEGQVKLVRPVEELCIHFPAADDEDGVTLRKCPERIQKGCVRFDARNGPGAQNDVPSSRKRASERLPGRPSHKHRVAPRQALETSQILGNVPWEFASLAYDPVARQCRDDGQLHTATSNLIGSYDSYPINEKFSN